MAVGGSHVGVVCSLVGVGGNLVGVGGGGGWKGIGCWKAWCEV